MTPGKKPRGLGRGLDALLGDSGPVRITGAKPPEMGTGEDDALGAVGKLLQTLPIEYIRPNAAQPRRRFDEDAIEELAASIRARGLLQPILVRRLGPEAYEIVAGERRWRAAQRAGVHDMPVVIRALDDEAAAEIALIENLQRVDLNPMEEAIAYQRLADLHRKTQEEIAGAVGKSRSHVANIMRLNALPAKCRKAVEENAISMGHARALLGATNPEAALAQVLKNALSVRDTEAYVKRLNEAPLKGETSPREPGKSSVPGKKDADTRALEGDLSAALGLEVAIDHKPKGSGSLTISYRSIDQLDDLCKRLMGTGI